MSKKIEKSGFGKRVFGMKMMLVIVVSVLLFSSSVALYSVRSETISKGSKVDAQALASRAYDKIVTGPYIGNSSYTNASGIEGWTLYWTTKSDTKPVYRGTPEDSLVYDHAQPAASPYITRASFTLDNLYPDPSGWLYNSQVTVIFENATGYFAWTYMQDTGGLGTATAPYAVVKPTPVPSAALVGSDIQLSWTAVSAWENNTGAANAIVDAELKGYTIWRSNTDNATWNDNATIGTVVGSPTAWTRVGGTVASPIPRATTTWTDTTATAGTTNYYSIKLVFNGSANVESMWGGLGSNGVTVLVANNAPTLSNGAVNPTSGDTATWFNFTVKYNDSDNQAPAANYPKVRIQCPLGTPYGTENFTMNPGSWVGATDNYAAGRNYYYNTTLTASTYYNYTFNASDGQAANKWATEPAWTDAPDVTAPAATVDYIQIHNNTWNGPVVGAVSMTTDQTLTLWCAGYNYTSGFVNNISATWSKTGTLNAPSAGPATNIAFNPTTAGTSGTITVSYLTKSNATGTITVGVGALASIKITYTAGGTEVGTATLNVSLSQTLNLYASGYDADSNYISLISCTWGKTGTLDAPPAGPATNITFTPTTGSTSGTITATDGVYSDATGTITVITTPTPDTTAPAAPTGLTATPSNGVVDLSWNANTESDLAVYNIYRRTSGSDYASIGYVSAPTTTYHDTGLTNGVTYYYVIKAVDTTGNPSGYSNEVSAKPEKPAEGGKPGFIPGIGIIGTTLALLVAALIIYKKRRK